MSYTIDIYKGELKPRNNFIDYLFISFFPNWLRDQLKSSDFTPTDEADKVFKWKIRSGCALALWGAFKKVWVADVVAMCGPNIFTEEPSAAMIWAATLGFTVQILLISRDILTSHVGPHGCWDLN